ncbi:MAG: hypothetical protein PUI23_09880, partial [Bacteroidales bacterium]|nr:hypothetical protein [Bacteroidales bacterium]MDY5225913.1 hypothetical protein [Sodaliphilus sp.]
TVAVSMSSEIKIVFIMVGFYKLLANLCHSLKTHKHPAPKTEKCNNFFSQNPPILSKERFFVVVVKRLKALPLQYQNK